MNSFRIYTCIGSMRFKINYLATREQLPVKKLNWRNSMPALRGFSPKLLMCSRNSTNFADNRQCRMGDQYGRQLEPYYSFWTL